MKVLNNPRSTLVCLHIRLGSRIGHDTRGRYVYSPSLVIETVRGPKQRGQLNVADITKWVMVLAGSFARAEALFALQ